MKIRIIKEAKQIKEQQGKPATLIVGGFELMGQARADVRLVDGTSKIVHSVSKNGKDLATVQQQSIQEMTEWAATNGYTIVKTIKDPA